MEVAIVTGASRGIGRSIALKLSEKYLVVVNYLKNETKAMETVAMIEERGGKAIIARGDVSIYEDAKGIVEKASMHGDVRILVNNAGIYEVREFSRMAPSEWERIVEVNLYGVMNMTHAVLDHMREGVIVNISSVIGIHPIAHAAPYCASKAAVIAFTKSIAEELYPRIRVVCVAPGPTDTDMLRRFHGPMFADPPEKVADYIMHAIENGRPGECIEVR